MPGPLQKVKLWSLIYGYERKKSKIWFNRWESWDSEVWIIGTEWTFFIISDIPWTQDENHNVECWPQLTGIEWTFFIISEIPETQDENYNVEYSPQKSVS